MADKKINMCRRPAQCFDVEPKDCMLCNPQLVCINNGMFKLEEGYEHLDHVTKEEMSPEELYAPLTQDPIVNSVIERFKQRSDVGMKTYGMSMFDNPAKILAWVQHAQEELMDSILYLERMKRELNV